MDETKKTIEEETSIIHFTKSERVIMLFALRAMINKGATKASSKKNISLDDQKNEEGTILKAVILEAKIRMARKLHDRMLKELNTWEQSQLKN